MLVNILMPDAAIVRDVRAALRVDEDITVTVGSDILSDVLLIHASMLPREASALRRLTSSDRAVVVMAAPRDPEILAYYLASGVNGYHFAGESWRRLRDVVRDVHAGGYRHDPYVIEHLLEHYRALRKRSQRSNGYGPFVH